MIRQIAEGLGVKNHKGEFSNKFDFRLGNKVAKLQKEWLKDPKSKYARMDAKLRAKGQPGLRANGKIDRFTLQMLKNEGYIKEENGAILAEKTMHGNSKLASLNPAPKPTPTKEPNLAARDKQQEKIDDLTQKLKLLEQQIAEMRKKASV